MNPNLPYLLLPCLVLWLAFGIGKQLQWKGECPWWAIPYIATCLVMLAMACILAHAKLQPQ